MTQYVCPSCRGPLAGGGEGYECEPCGRRYPVLCGIADFRLEPDPYIGLEADRAKGVRLWEQAQRLSYEELLRHYYEITDEVPPDLAARWIQHSLAEPEIAAGVLEEGGLGTGGGEMLDVGCSTGGMVIAASRRGWRATGVDVAFRWLVVGRARLKAAGVEATLVCANAERLPFAEQSFDAVSAQDTLEHLRDAGAGLREGRRVSKEGAPAIWTTNNRYAPLPEPHLHLWGVGYLKREWQARYVRWRRDDTHPYSIRLRSGREIRRMLRAAGYEKASVGPAPLVAPHWPEGMGQRVLRAYNAVRVAPGVREVLTWAGPRLWVEARR